MRGRGKEAGPFSQRPVVSFRSREQNKSATSRPSSPGALITLNTLRGETRAVCAPINPPAFFLCNLKQNSISAAVAAGHNKYISSNFGSGGCQNSRARFNPKS